MAHECLAQRRAVPGDHEDADGAISHTVGRILSPRWAVCLETHDVVTAKAKEGEVHYHLANMEKLALLWRFLSFFLSDANVFVRALHLFSRHRPTLPST